MPTNTFFNLPEEKREKLINAIKDEFSRVRFDEVSINKIVQAADIARGSFYQYFSDKNDMLEYILTSYRKEMVECAKNSLKENDGDIFIAFYDILNVTKDFYKKEQVSGFCENLFADIKINTDFYLRMPKDSYGKIIIMELQPYINYDLLDLQDEDDFQNMLEILFSVCRDGVAEVFMNLSETEHIMQKYLEKLELLKRGFIKK